jgi:pimeloyl-[acyl-carrier protein] synthase
LTRLALDEFDIEGRTIHKGDAVILHMAAANRDPDVFSNPDRFDIARKPNRHLAFGWGRHFCLGAPLARIEAEVAIKTVLQRYPTIRLQRSELTWVKNMSNRCLTSIPATVGFSGQQ